MNSSNTALQSGHHHHHQPASAGVNQQFQHSSTAQVQKVNPAVNPNPSVHQFQTLNENPWQLQTQFQQHIQGSNTGPIPPLRHHKKSAPLPPAGVSTSSSKPALQHLTVTSTYNNQPVYLITNSAQTQTTPGLAPQSVLHSPKSPNQNSAHQSANVMSSSLTSGNFTSSSSSMVNNHQTSHHHPTSSLSNSNISNNNNNNNFDDLNVNGPSSFGSSTSNQKKVDLRHNTMP